MSPQRRKEPEMMPGFHSLLAVAVRQFGAGMLVAAVFGLAVARMYGDLERKSDTLVSLVREQSLASREVAEALRDLTKQLGQSDR